MGEEEEKAPPQRYKDWPDFFSRLRPNDGAHDPALYPADHGQPMTGTGKTEL